MRVEDVRVERVTDDAGFSRAWDVRYEVFVQEQAVPEELERDDLDAAATHWLAVAGDEVVGTVRMVPEHGDTAHLGRLAVRAPARGTGVGRLLVAAVEDEGRALGLTSCVLGAQVQAVPFYERLGYAAYGEEFDDAGIPHRWMRKPLQG
ncbi:putative GNAT family N-acyltransferase [Motilibacter rhizosphaerae]|uniref:Putative GNAT family N-acyltransferase n=1 Tax=Motilibacter rhizosphaerae TaxID=598652 RepID=A0A4Q7NG38_9ACTN|nr:GNAT family N-acetyltransferase [Motilibacter rhizosphaerae]RZS82897.1 putative GNAT family N-acyltransferase [Motilibacter rhizosphaerae]